MKHLKRTGLLWRLALSVIVLSAVVYGCRKETRHSNDPSQDVDVTQLQTIYNQGIITSTQQTNAVYASPQLTLVHSLNVSWNKFHKSTRADGSRIVEFTVNDTSRTFMKKLNTGDLIPYNDKSEVVFVQKTDGTTLSYFMKVVEDLTVSGTKSTVKNFYYGSVPAGFSGTVLYYTLNRQYLNGYRYKNGKITADISVVVPVTTTGNQQVASVNGTKTNMVAAPTCYEVDYYQEYCEWGGTADDPYEYFHGCDETYIGSTIECDDDGSGGGGGGGAAGDTGGGGGGGSTPTPPPPCSPPLAVEVAGGKQVIMVAQPVTQPVDGGGTNPNPNPGTGTTPCPTVTPAVQDIKDSVSNPCLKGLITQLASGGAIQNDVTNMLRNTFGVNDDVNLTFKQETIAGSTDDATTDGQKGDIVITFNTPQIASASQEYMMESTMHEIFHAYLDQNPTVKGNLTQHTYMIQNYINMEVGALRQYFPNLSVHDAECIALAGYGALQSSNPAAFNAAVSSYNLTTNDITSTNANYKAGTSGTKC